jgi:hypothetical protein
MDMNLNNILASTPMFITGVKNGVLKIVDTHFGIPQRLKE